MRIILILGISIVGALGALCSTGTCVVPSVSIGVTLVLSWCAAGTPVSSCFMLVALVAIAAAVPTTDAATPRA